MLARPRTVLALLTVCVGLSIDSARGKDGEHEEQAKAGKKRLTLESVTEAVLRNNPGVKEALKKWNAMRERIPQMEAWEDPKLNVGVRVARFVPVSPNGFMDQMVGIEQMLPLSGKNRVRARIAAAEALAAFEDARRQELDAIMKARAAFFQLLNAYGQLELNQKTLDLLKQIADSSVARYEAGTETQANVLATEIEAGRMREARRDLERKLSEAETQVNVLMNRDAFEPVEQPLGSKVEPVALGIAELRSLALANRPEVRMAQSRIEAEKAKLQLALREKYPDPSLTLSGQRYNAASQVVSEIDLGISIPLPWFNRKKYAAQEREASNGIEAAQYALDRAQKEAIGMLRDQLRKIETAQHHLELFRDKLLPQTQQAFEANRGSYETGKATFLEWIGSQRSLREMQAMELEHRTDYQMALAELEAVVGAELRRTSVSQSKTKGKSK
uniref:Outer membrane efflux protein n=1 Tax=uncultured Acidobacteria bacterium A11 TaxID=1036854 RepID=F8TTJ8_9BACT|nr:outer membrane efflux protein [uncultured Acidobacteria bacterium A11]